MSQELVKKQVLQLLFTYGQISMLFILPYESTDKYLWFIMGTNTPSKISKHQLSASLIIVLAVWDEILFKISKTIS